MSMAGTQADAPQAELELEVSFGKQAAALAVPAGATLAMLADALAARFGVAPHTVKLLLPGGRGALKLTERPTETVLGAGARHARTVCGGGRV